MEPMAGSYEHLTHGWSLIEHMGDAHEAVEELLWLVERVIGQDEAQRLLSAEYYPMCRGEWQRDEVFARVRDLMSK
jgi:hypothetical protein